MKRFIKKNSVYFITALIVIGLISVIYLVKNIFPFGSYSLIWSDMHEQITSFYYHFYDSIKGNQSLFIDFKTGLGINFMGTFGYYLSSVFSLILLLFPRNYLYLGISIIVILKFVFCAETTLYAIKKLFPKLSNWHLIILSILYAFSGYTLSNYVITGWMDVVILFPLLCLGLKKLIDNHDCKMYLIILTASIISCFYISFMTLIFVLLASFLYVFIYQEKEVRKKSLILLGFSTVISILLSSVILCPTICQILDSSRGGLDISSILNSGLGPITDKLSLFFLSGFSFATLLLLINSGKEHRKFLKLILILLVILLLPIIFEGINKIWHFGSYSFFTMRFAFIPIFILLIGSAYYLNIKETKEITSNKITYIVLTVCVVIFMIFISMYGYNGIQFAIDSLTLSSSKKVFVMLFIMFILVVLSVWFLIKKLGKNNRLCLVLVSIILLTHVTINLFFYLGIDYDKERLNLDYDSMQLISEDYDNSIYRLKNLDYNLFSNFGNVALYQTASHFTSLTKESTIDVLDQLGYSSIWTKILSSSGSLFSDILLANKYILSENEIDNPYYSLDKVYNNRNFYKSELDISFGYLVDNNKSLKTANNSFEASNIIYSSITGEEKIFTMYNSFQKDGKVLKQEIFVKDKEYLYLDISTLDKIDDYGIMNFAKVVVNGKEVRTTYPKVGENGLLELGVFEDEKVNIEITMLKDVSLDSLVVGGMNIDLFEDFIKEEKVEADIQFIENKVLINLDSEEEKILFLPIAYDEGYKAYNNGKLVTIEKIFDGFIGIKLTEGNNNITLSFVPKGLKLGLIMSVISVILALLFCKFKDKLLSLKIISSFVFEIYIVLVFIVILVMYITPMLTFIGGVF